MGHPVLAIFLPVRANFCIAIPGHQNDVAELPGLQIVLHAGQAVLGVPLAAELLVLRRRRGGREQRQPAEVPRQVRVAAAVDAVRSRQGVLAGAAHAAGRGHDAETNERAN